MAPVTYSCSSISQAFGDVAASKTTRLFITNSVLAGSKDLSSGAQEALAHAIGFEMLGLLPAITLCFLTYVSSEGATRLYGVRPSWTYSRLSQKIDGNRLAFGCFSWDGLDVVDSGKFESVGFGAGALREFEGH